MAVQGNTGRDLNALRREKETALISMGKLLHKLIRDGSIRDEACIRLSDRIRQIDVEISMSDGNRVPAMGEGICPNCSEPLSSPMATFCGSCGTNMNEYYSRSMAQCGKCGQLTRTDASYCTICGNKHVS